MRYRIILLLLWVAGCAAPQVTPAPASDATASPMPTVTGTPTLAPTATATPVPLPPPTPEPSMVVIISVDGLRPDALQSADAPNIFALARRGAYTWTAQTIFPPVTLPAHASMISGYTPTGHGIIWNDNLPGRGVIAVNTIFHSASAAGLQTAMVVGKDKLAQFDVPSAVDSFTFSAGGDPDVAAGAVERIHEGYDLLFVHLPNTDFFGHRDGWMSATYVSQLASTDAAVGQIIEALPPHATIIITADHGGHDFIHGSRIPEDMTIPWIIAGPRVITDHLLTTPITVVDTAATAAFVLGVAMPGDISGRVVYEAFGMSPPNLLTGMWQGGASQQPPRSEMPAATLNGLIYVPGGFGGEGAFQAYDPGADTWLSLATLPEGRHHLMAAAVGGNVYIFGGAAANSWSATSTAFRYDPQTNRWSGIRDMPEPRLSGVAVTMNNKVYIVGGAGGSAALLEYDPSVDAWRALDELRQAREHLAAVALDGKIYALGGRWGGQGEFDSVEVFDSQQGAWQDGVSLLRPHSGFAAAVVEDQIVVAGGEVFTGGWLTLDDVSVFDPSLGYWQSAPRLPVPLHGLAMAAVDGQVIVIGGSLQAGAIHNDGRVLIYQP